MLAISRKLLLITMFCIGLFVKANAQDKWPKEIPFTGGGVITIYEPQSEKLSGNTLDLRAAVSVRKKSGDEPLFGAMWLQAQLSSASQGISTVTNVKVKQAKFGGDDDQVDSDDFRKSVENGFPRLRAQFSSENIQASISREQGGEDLKNDPPLIIYRDKPTNLIVLDGEPVEETDDDLKMVRVVNTPYLIVKNPDDKKYYLYGGSFWYASSRIKDGWVNVKSLPSRIRAVDAKMKEEEQKASSENDEVSKFTTPTDILVVTEPAELIQTEGKPTYQAVQGSTLLYVNNSLDEIFKDIDSQKNYILIAGRWYNGTSLNGPWLYVSQDNLPRAFADIPAGSEKDGVLSSVAGTEEAYDAVMEAQIPQTAKVDRSTARVEVNYDGDPRFVPIANTNLSIAENSNITVMQAANNAFYALENGIWFISNSPYGPWQVANERPSDVDRIPPSSSAYNARFVYIYETTPQYVYVGYTRGYMGNYIFGPTVVWGTGWHYRPWRGRYYRPRPVTWGFGMHYNPWAGWSMSFNLGFNVGWYHYARVRPYYGGWFGPPAYRPPVRPWGWNGGYYGSRQGNRYPSYANRPRPNVSYNRPVNNNRRPVYVTNNIYRDRKSVVVTRDNVFRPVPSRQSTRPSTGNGSDRRQPSSDRTNTTRPTTGSGTSERTRPVGNNNRENARPSTGREQTTFPGGSGSGEESRQNTRPSVTRPATQERQNNRTGTAQPSTRQEPTPRPTPQPTQNNRQNTRPAVTPNQNNRPNQTRQPAVNQSKPANTRQNTQPARQSGERSNSRNNN